jgi:FdhE protein
MAAADTKKILARLRAAKKKNPALAEVVDLHHDLIEARAVRLSPLEPGFGAQEAKAFLSQGTPLLHTHDVAVNWETFSALYDQICNITVRHRPDLADQFQSLQSLLKEHPDRIQSLAAAFIQAGELTDSELLAEIEELLVFVFNHALYPFLRSYADALYPLVEEQLWQRGQCPVCGGEPDLALLDDETGGRHLICSRCDSQWVFPRIRCPFCNTVEPSHLSYYPTDDEMYRVYVCRNCQRYVKTVDLRKTRRQVILPAERVTTVTLDVLAREEGFR